MVRRIAILGLALSLFFNACKKKNKECTYHYYHTPAYIGMQGFGTSELHTLYLREYVPDGTYSQLTRQDTVSLDSLTIVGGLAYSHNSIAFFSSLEERKNYEVEVPAASRTFHIGGVYYHGAASFTVEEAECGGRTFFNAPDSTIVDGVPVAISERFGATSYFFLQK